MGFFTRAQGIEVALDVYTLPSGSGWVVLKAPEALLGKLAGELLVADRPGGEEASWAAVLALRTAGPDGVSPAPRGARWAQVVKPLSLRPRREDGRVELSRPVALFDDTLEVEGRTVSISPDGALVKLPAELEPLAGQLNVGRKMHLRLKIKGPELPAEAEILENGFPMLRLRFEADAGARRRIAGELAAVGRGRHQTPDPG